jgi:hypothetical protein
MKTIGTLSVLILLTSLVFTGMAFAEDPVKTGNGSTGKTGSGMGWQQGAIRTASFYCGPFRFSVGANAGLQGPFIGVSLGCDFGTIECCKPYPLKESWCNYDADDERCPN